MDVDEVGRFESRCRHLRAGLIVADADGLVSRVGSAAADLLQTEPAKLVGRRVSTLLQRWSGRARAEVRSALEGSSWTFTWSVSTPDGERMLRAIARRTERRTELVIDDISERMRRAHELNALYLLTDRLEAAVIREERAAPVAHDLGNLLGVLVTELEQDARPRITALLHRAIELTRRLRQDSQSRRLGVGALDLDELLQQMLPLIRALAGSEVALNLEVASTEPVFWSAEHVRSVLSNLVVNARRAGASRITIRLRVEEGEVHSGGRKVLPLGRWLRLTVEDDGTGMTEAEKELALRLAPHGSESGVGLPWVCHLATEARGCLCLDTVEGVGTSVHVLVPISDERGDTVPGSPQTNV